MDICSSLFIIALPVIAKYWKQSNRRLSEWNVHIMEYYAAVTKE